MYVNKSQRVPLLHFLALYAIIMAATLFQVPSHAVAREERRSRGCSEEAPPPVQPRRNSNADAPPIPARRTKPPPVNFHNVDAPRSHNHTVQFQVQQRGVVPPPSPSYEGNNKHLIVLHFITVKLG